MVDLPLDIAGKPFKDNEYAIIINNECIKYLTCMILVAVLT